MTYDIRGNKIAMSDADMGCWEYSYNALGLLVGQTNANGQITEIEYDVLGRMTKRTDDVGGKLFEAIDDNGVAERRHYIGDFAVVTDYIAINERVAAYYLTDHLGSIDVITDHWAR